MELECSSPCLQEPAMGHSRKPKKSVYTIQGRIQVWWGLKFMQLTGPSLRKRIQNYENEIKYDSEYLFRKRKEITTNYKFKKADRY
jgi:hypothetical protein